MPKIPLTPRICYFLLLITTALSQKTAKDLPSIDAEGKELAPIPIRHLRSPAEFFKITQSKGVSLVVLYEQWCGYSQITLNILEQLSSNQDFLKTGVGEFYLLFFYTFFILRFWSVKIFFIFFIKKIRRLF